MVSTEGKITLSNLSPCGLHFSDGLKHIIVLFTRQLGNLELASCFVLVVLSEHCPLLQLLQCCSSKVRHIEDDDVVMETMKIAGLKFQLSDTIGTVPFVHRKGEFIDHGVGSLRGKASKLERL